MAITTLTRQNAPAFRVKLSGTQDIANATWTKVTFDSETIDSDGKFASNRFTPTVAGTYNFMLQVSIDDLAELTETYNDQLDELNGTSKVVLETYDQYKKRIENAALAEEREEENLKRLNSEFKDLKGNVQEYVKTHGLLDNNMSKGAIAWDDFLENLKVLFE